jgi:hypothetical protein
MDELGIGGENRTSILLGTKTAYCVCISLVLILVVKILGGRGTSSEDWYPLVLETTLPSRETS